jgi:hypothetical protein
MKTVEAKAGAKPSAKGAKVGMNEANAKYLKGKAVSGGKVGSNEAQRGLSQQSRHVPRGRD